ncbi:MAG: universal stress protein [Bacteroidia bacterium]|nr:universal stress protein [Bacteroidia bacterium]NND53293.1 universal stress protein [Flavobacteriaceae bacterium]
MKKILLPTDFSANSWNAIKYALQLFKEEECSFYLLNAYTPIVYHIEYVIVNPAQFGMGDPIRENSLQGLDSMCKKIDEEFNNPKHHFESIAAFNSLIPEIKAIVADKSIDYVVMGTKGATGAKEVLFGSNTVHVFKNIDCPVLAIPDNFDFENPLEILFPSDFQIDFQDDHIKPIVQIAENYHSRVTILHVLHQSGLSDFQKENKSKLETFFKSVAHLFFEMKYQNIREAIANYQMKSRVNLLVMINNKHSFFEKLFFKPNISQIGLHIHVPFLVIPSEIRKSA